MASGLPKARAGIRSDVIETWVARFLSWPSLLGAAISATYGVYTKILFVQTTGANPTVAALVMDVITGKAVSIFGFTGLVVGSSILAGRLGRSERRVRYGTSFRHAHAVTMDVMSWTSALLAMSLLAIAACSFGPQEMSLISAPEGPHAQGLQVFFGAAPWLLVGVTVLQLFVFSVATAAAVVLLWSWIETRWLAMVASGSIFCWVLLSEGLAQGASGYRSSDFAKYPVAFAQTGVFPVHLTITILGIALLLAHAAVRDSPPRERFANYGFMAIPVLFAVAWSLLAVRYVKQGPERGIESFLWSEGSHSLVGYVTALSIYVVLPSAMALHQGSLFFERRFEICLRIPSPAMFWWVGFSKQLRLLALVTVSIVGFGEIFVAVASHGSVPLDLATTAWAAATTYVQLAAVSAAVWLSVSARGRVTDGIYGLVVLAVALSPNVAWNAPELASAIPFLSGALSRPSTTLASSVGLIVTFGALSIYLIKRGHTEWMGTRE